jgi:chorismate mutase/prephenate dehydratase
VFGVFAFDSSVEGLHLPAIFALAETDLVIVAERTVAAVLCLMSRSGDRKDVQRIYATAAGHAASEHFVEREYPQADVHDVRSPVEAAERVLEDAGAAAILPEPTGRHHGLRTVRENVSNEAELKYRFGVVASRPASRTGKDTTCLLFSLDDAPGTLYQVLSHFAERGLNLKRIQSRPVRAASWDYVFYVEVSGHATDRAVVTALEAVKRSTKYLKLLGSFPTES